MPLVTGPPSWGLCTGVASLPYRKLPTTETRYNSHRLGGVTLGGITSSPSCMTASGQSHSDAISTMSQGSQSPTGASSNHSACSTSTVSSTCSIPWTRKRPSIHITSSDVSISDLISLWHEKICCVQ